MNELYPIFLKVNQLNVLIIGGGNVALEKLGFMLKSSPNAKVEIVSESFLSSIIKLSKNPSVQLTNRSFEERDLLNKQLVISATDSFQKNKEIYLLAKKRNILINVADTPEYCDFYLGGIVTKGDVKIAISTNGKSPTTAKRLRQFFEDILPENIDEMVQNLHQYRKKIKGDFNVKVSKLNELTKTLIN